MRHILKRHAEYGASVLQGITYAKYNFANHLEIAQKLAGAHPYTVTILIENLRFELGRRKEFVNYTRHNLSPLYRELLYKYLYKEHGDRETNRLYGEWIEAYRGEAKPNSDGDSDIDEIIIKQELEPRYRKIILQRYSKHALFRPRYRWERERKYNLPPPLNRVDWRNPFDQIFVWREDGRKVARRGGSGGSGQRQTYSLFSFGLASINQQHPVPSYLFIYDDENRLWFVEKFSSLCLPRMDLGSNYHLPPAEMKEVLRGAKLFRWDLAHEPIREIVFEKI